MTISKLSLIGYISGIIIIVCVLWRWFFVSFVRTYLAFGLAIGFICIVGADYFNWRKKVNEWLQDLQNQADATGEIATGNKGLGTEEKARGGWR